VQKKLAPIKDSLTPAQNDQDRLELLARLQQFDGSFKLDDELLRLLDLPSDEAARKSLSVVNLLQMQMANNAIVAAVLAIQWMCTALVDLKDSWVSLAEKTIDWLADSGEDELARKLSDVIQ
jgi:hypothetical protein